MSCVHGCESGWCVGKCAKPPRDAYYRRLGELARGSLARDECPFLDADRRRWWLEGWDRG